MAQGAQAFGETADLSFEILLSLEIPLQLEAFHLGELLPPSHIFLLETLAFRMT